MGEWSFRPAGEGALYVVLGERATADVRAEVQAVVHSIRQGLGDRVRDVVPGYVSVYVEFDPEVWAVGDLQRAIETLAGVPQLPLPSRLITVPVRYGDEWGPDLRVVAEENGISEEEVVSLHVRPTYEVSFIGFTPGFPFLAGLDERLAIPRLAVPRRRVPRGSVGIAGLQTGIYSVDSPGGWRIIGRTGLLLFDPRAPEPVLIRPGDTVRFVQSTEALPVGQFIDAPPVDPM
jgi:KipI family sensor histidine kinase inhibitor